MVLQKCIFKNTFVKRSPLPWGIALILIISAMRLIRLYCIPIVFVLLSCEKQLDYAADTANKQQLLQSKSSKPALRVVGYFPEWVTETDQIQFDKLTHINYAFLIPTSTGALKPIDNPTVLRKIVATAHLNKVKVLASVGGWNNGDQTAFSAIAKSTVLTEKFTTNLLNIIASYDLDGIDIDWESPTVGVTDAGFSQMITALSASLHKQNKLLSIAVNPTNQPAILDGVFAEVDYVNIMAYDSFDYAINHSPVNLAEAALTYWANRGLPASKANLGLPFYGRSRAEWDWTSYVLFKDIVSSGGSATADQFNTIGYNGANTIKAKASLAFARGSGVMIWELSGDAKGANSLLSAVNSCIPK